MTTDRVGRLRRALLVLCVLAAAYAIVVVLTGGFAVSVAGIRLSSRSARNPVMVSLLSAAAVWTLSGSAERSRAWRSDAAVLATGVAGFLASPEQRSRVRLAAAVMISAGVVAVGLLKGSFVAGGSDSYGYVSQAHLWAAGRLRVEQPFMRELTWPFASLAAAPLGYRPAPEGASIVPTYSPGLPMLMGLFERVGGREAVFLVVPVLGGIAVWATYLIGANLGGSSVGLAAALLLATSPVFLAELLNPVSDVPAAGWWALSLALVVRTRRSAALGAGLAAGAAILTRPNLVLLAMIPGAFLLTCVLRERDLMGRAAQRAALLAAGAIPGCVAVAVLNAIWYGSALTSGYGTLGELYRPGNVWPNLARYPTWLLTTQTPVVLLGLAAPPLISLRNRGRQAEAWAVSVMCLSFIVGVCGSYLLYRPFDSEAYVRFLLPALPPLLALTSAAIGLLAARLPGRMAPVMMIAAIMAVSCHGVRDALNGSVFSIREVERKYAAIGQYVARELPDRAVVFSMQHSGSVRYYSGRLTIRYDLLPVTRLDWALRELSRLGYRPYFVLERWEEDLFRERFGEHSRLAALDWPPLARLAHGADVRIYDPADRTIPEASGHRATQLIY